MNQRQPAGWSGLNGATRVSTRRGDGPTAAHDDSALLRLAIWLAEVSAEAARLTTAPAANATATASAPPREKTTEPPAAGPTS